MICKSEELGHQHYSLEINALPNGKILDWSKLKAFADDRINVAELMFSLSDRIENIVGKGENTAYQHFLLFPQCFQKPSTLKSGLCDKELEVPRNRGYLFFSVKDRNLFHQMDTIGNIFTRGCATCGCATGENITDGVHEMK